MYLQISETPILAPCVFA